MAEKWVGCKGEGVAASSRTPLSILIASLKERICTDVVISRAM
jgi:hypothetical protein